MTTVKNAVVVGAVAIAAVFGQLAVAAPAEAKRCPSGTVPTKFEGVCTAGSSGGLAPPVLPPSSGPQVVSAPGQIPTVNGIPCTIEHYGTCLAMTQP